MNENSIVSTQRNAFEAVQAKQYLTLKEAADLLNISPLTLRRWTFKS